MKKLFTVFICLALLNLSFTNNKGDNSLARVKTISGKLVFYNNEPIEKYEVVFSFENIIPNYETVTTQKVMDVSAQNAMNEAGLQGGKQFDAIITRPNTKRDLAIRFIDDTKDNAIARVSRINGKYIFIECEPINDYEIVSNIKVSLGATRQQTIDKILKKAFKEEKNGKNFGAILFGSTKYDNSIKFKGHDVSRGGISIGAKVSFIEGNRVNYGEVVELESSKNKGSVKYFNIFKEEKVKKLSYTDMTPLSEEDYIIKKEEFKKEIEKYKYQIGEKVTWIKNDETKSGEIVSLHNKYHKASIKYLNIYGEEKITSISYLDINKITEEDYQKHLEEQKKEIQKHSFKIGEKVTWIKTDFFGKNAQQLTGEIVDLDNTYHKASVKYIDENNEEKIAKVSYLDLTKVKE